jgi:heme exporter protein C
VAHAKEAAPVDADTSEKAAFAERIPGWLVWGAVVLAMYLGFIYAPPEATMGDSQRIMYFHVAAAWNAFLAFGVVLVASIDYLRRGRPGASRLAYASAEIGVLFTTVCIVGGSVWARAVWNVWWTWDPRLTTTALLWFIFIGYLVVRGSAEGDRSRQRLAAVIGVIGACVVPVVYFSDQWWVGMHPNLITLKGFAMPGRMVVALMYSFCAFTVFYLWLLGKRLRLVALAEQVAALRDRFRV